MKLLKITIHRGNNIQKSKSNLLFFFRPTVLHDHAASRLVKSYSIQKFDLECLPLYETRSRIALGFYCSKHMKEIQILCGMQWNLGLETLDLRVHLHLRVSWVSKILGFTWIIAGFSRICVMAFFP